MGQFSHNTYIRLLMRTSGRPWRIDAKRGVSLVLSIDECIGTPGILLIACELTNTGDVPAHVRSVDVLAYGRSIVTRAEILQDVTHNDDGGVRAHLRLADGSELDCTGAEWSTMRAVAGGYLRPSEAIIGFLCIRTDSQPQIPYTDPDLCIRVRIAGQDDPITIHLC
jgi:hypothetical protein